MADAEVSVTVRPRGFNELAAEAERAEVALKEMGAAARGASSQAGASASEEAAKINALANATRTGLVGRATQIGNEMRATIAGALTNGSFWTKTFDNLKGRFRAFGQALGKELNTGIQASQEIKRLAYGTDSNGNVNKPTHTDLIGGAAVGYGAFISIEKIVKASADRQGALFKLNSLGTLNKDQQGALVGLADSWTNNPNMANISQTEGLRFLTDAAQIFGGPEHMFTDDGKGKVLTPQAISGLTQIAQTMAFAKAYLAATGKEGNPEEIERQFSDMLRSGEIKGLGSNPQDLANWTSKLMRVWMATGVDPATFLTAQRNAGISFLTLDDDGLYGFASMVQENKVRAGTMLRTGFLHQIGGNNQQMRGNEALRSLGLFGDEANIKRLAADGKIELNKKGQISYVKDPTILPGYYQDASNPYKWDADVLYPAIRKKIMEDTGEDIGDATKKPSERTTKELTDIIRGITSGMKNPLEANQAAEAIVQYAQMQRRGEAMKKTVTDVEGAQDLVTSKLQQFNAQLQNLSVNLGDGILPMITQFLAQLNGVLKSFGGLLKDHPMIGKLAGAGLIGLGVAGGWSALRLAGGLFKTPVVEIIGALSWTYRLMKGLTTGAFAFTKLGDIVGKDAMIKGTGKVASTLENIVGRLPKVSRILGSVGKILGWASGIGTAAYLGYEATQSDAGQAYLSWWETHMRALRHPDNERLKRLDELKRNDANNAIRALWGGDPTAPTWRNPMINPWLNRYYNQRSGGTDWIGDLRQPEKNTFVRRFLPHGGASFGGGNSSPIPVVVTQMPNQKVPPPQVNVGGVTVNVQGLDGAPDAAADAVRSKMQNALSDQHH